MSYQPKTGERCTCRRGMERDNCPRCEGTGQVIDFARVRALSKVGRLSRAALVDVLDEVAGVGCVDERSTDDLRAEVERLTKEGLVTEKVLRDVYAE